MEKKVCECCGAYLVDQTTKWVCEHCLTEYKKSFVESDEVQRLLNMANKTRLENKFIDAKNEYTNIINKFPDSVDAYWGRLLSELGIEYVKSPEDIYYPSCHRLTFSNIFTEDDFKMTIKLADEESKKWYKEKAEQIENIRLELINLTKNFQPFDIFISYKENDENGNVTKDSQYMTDLYHMLTRMGLKVFMARITLGQIAGSKYEPYIYSAISTAKVMIVYSTQKEYIEATWLKNEWSRYLELIKTGQKKKGSIIPIYNGMDPYDFPIEFSGIQGLNANDLNFKEKLQKIIYQAIGRSPNQYVQTKYFKKKELKGSSSFKVNSSLIPSLSKRKLGNNLEAKEFSINEEKTLANGYNFLDKRLFDAAIVQFNTILRKNKTNYKAYFGRFMASLAINEAFLHNLNHSKFTPHFERNLNIKDVELALDYAPTKQMAEKILNNCILIFRYMQYWKINTSYKYEVITSFYKLLISYTNIDNTNELKEILWEDFEYVNENDMYYVENLLKLHQVSVLSTEDSTPEAYINETSKIVRMLLKNKQYKKAKELNDKLLKIDAHESELLFNQGMITLKTESDVLFIEAIIYLKKYKALESLITRAKNPDVSIKRILSAIKDMNLNLFLKQYKKAIKVIDISLSYLSNFETENLIKELIYFGNYHLELSKFKECEKYFNEVIELDEQNVEALWGLVKAQSKARIDYDLVTNEVDLIRIDNFNQLISTEEDTTYYFEIYEHIKQGTLNTDKLMVIKNKHLGILKKYIQKNK